MKGDELIEPNVIILHLPPVTPSEGHRGWTAVNLYNLPSKSWHHTLECLMGRCEIGIGRAVKFIRSNDGVISAHLEHILRGLRWPSVDRKGIVGMVNGPPILQVGFERSLDFPILDEIFHQRWQAGCFVGHLLGCHFDTR